VHHGQRWRRLHGCLHTLHGRQGRHHSLDHGLAARVRSTHDLAILVPLIHDPRCASPLPTNQLGEYAYALDRTLPAQMGQGLLLGERLRPATRELNHIVHLTPSEIPA
jgi:hypothetical protein